jgi:hypothetical protein
MFRELNEALADAGIAAWYHKYKYSTWRPISAIQDTIDPSWKPLLGTPPFPEYISGHSTFSGAAGRVLISHFGNRPLSVTDYFGYSASFPAISVAVYDAGRSRVCGGIHFEFSNLAAINLGYSIAEQVLARF